MAAADPSHRLPAPRPVPWWVFLLLALLVTVVPAAIAVLVLGGGVAIEYPDVRSVVVDFVVPSAVVLIAIAAITSVLRLWDPVLHDRRPVRRWLWIVPGSLLVTAAVVSDYRRILDEPLVALIGSIGILLLVTTEELVFRGVVLTEARRRTTEGRAAWISSITFGLIHALGGPIQVLVSIAFGHMAYYTRRVSGGIVLPIVVHWAWNTSLFTDLVGEPPYGDGAASVYLSLVSFVVLAGLSGARRFIEPPDQWTDEPA